MSRFRDVYLPNCVTGYGAVSSPRFSTDITVTDNGAENANQRWERDLMAYNLPQAVRDLTGYYGVQDHWRVMNGPAYTFPYRDPMDHASVNLTQIATAPTVSNTDQQIGIGNGAQTQFQLKKTVTLGAYTYERAIYKPVVASVVIAIDSVGQGSGWTVDRESGIVTFDSAVGLNDVVTAGFLYDVEVRYAGDDVFEGIARSFNAGGYADIQLVEVRPC